MTLSLQFGGSRRLFFRGMLPAIQFYDKPRVFAEEIDNIRRNRMLPPEFETGKLAVAQMLPQKLFSIRLILAQTPRSIYGTGHRFRS